MKGALVWVVVAGCGGGVAAAPDAAPPAVCSSADPAAVVEQELFGPCASCHGGATPDAELEFFLPSDVEAMFDAPSRLCPDKVLVVPGDPAASYLIEKLVPRPTCGEIMPTLVPLPAETVACFEQWIAELAPTRRR